MKLTLLEIFVSIFILIFLSLIIYAVYSDYTAEKIFLNKSEWECKKTSTYYLYIYDINLKNTIHHPVTECVEYVRTK